MTAAQLAEILDPSHDVEGWWKFECYRNQADGRFKFRTTNENPRLPNDGTFTIYTTYIGPPDLHTAREHAWRMENYLWNQGCTITRWRGMETNIRKPDHEVEEFATWSHANHSAALLEAVEEIMKGNKG